MSTLHRDPFLLTVLSVFMALAVAWALFLPPFEGVDEQNHFHYMVFLKDQGRLPRQLPLPSDVPGQGHQPPLYYALGAAGLRILQPDASYQEPVRRQDTRFGSQPAYFQPVAPLMARPLVMLRLLQLLFLLLPALLLGAGVLGSLLPSRHEWRLGLALLLLNPAFIAGAGALNNDLGALAMACVALASLQPAWQGKPLGIGRWGLAGALLGLAGLMKPTALGLLPAPLLLLSEQPRGGRGLKAAAFLLAGGAVLAPWLWRNQALYGDLTGLHAWRADCPQCPQTGPVTLGWLQWWCRHVFESYWGVFGWMTWRLPAPATAAFAGLSLGALLGLARLRARPRWFWPSLAGVAGVAALLLVLAIRPGPALLPPAGRYFNVAWLPLALLSGGGLGAWAWLRRDWVPWVLAAALTGLNLWVLDRMFSLYR
jgi:hypothetical protein